MVKELFFIKTNHVENDQFQWQVFFLFEGNLLRDLLVK